MNVIIAGAARDIEKYWENTKKSLDIIFKSVDNYLCIIVESNSTDNSLQCLNNWANNDSKKVIISLGKQDLLIRTQRIATARNTYMNYINDNKLYNTFNYLLVVDLDDALNIEDNFKEQLNSCFKITDWDAIASNRNDKYYDIWALRSKSEILNCDFDCNNHDDDRLSISFCRYSGRKLVNKVCDNPRKNEYMQNPASLNKNIPRDTGFIECSSAFGGMALYKTNAICDKLYNGDLTCEHLSFHSGLKMYINTEFISG
jgi:hypothetical protein